MRDRGCSGKMSLIQKAKQKFSSQTNQMSSMPPRDVEETQSTTPTVVDSIQKWDDIRAAFALSWASQKRHLFTSWIHVPFGVILLLVTSWAMRLAINVAPFRFPAPVIVMLALFFALLLLDWLSDRFSVKKELDLETARVLPERQRKRFIDPVMALLAPPCEFCLRNMSVMFTPSFILIPAREMIPGKEIGLLAAWFAITQVLGYVVPVLLAWAMEWAIVTVQKLRPAPSDDAKGPIHPPTLPGVDFEKGLSFHGGRQLSTLATGLSGVTATVIAPVTHVPMRLTEDERRHIESSAMEFARQQGDPAVICDRHRGRSHRRLQFDTFSPRSDVSSYEHHVHSHDHFARARPAAPRSKSAHATVENRSRHRSLSPRTRTLSRLGRATSTMALGKAPTNSLSVDLPLRPANAKQRNVSIDSDIDTRRGQDRRHVSQGLSSCEIEVCKAIEEERVALSVIPSAEATAVSSRRGSISELNGARSKTQGLTSMTPVAVQNHSQQVSLPVRDMAGDKGLLSGREEEKLGSGNEAQGKTLAEVEMEDCNAKSIRSNRDGVHGKEEEVVDDDDNEDNDNDVEADAITRLSSWINDLITPSAYFLLFVVGIPLYFVCDIALPLFLAINILTFLASITIVPPKIRRFAHPILSTSIATVLLIWAFAAMKGIGLKTCLNRFYSVDAKYTEIWAPSGYRGPVPGAGDVLFSTLDAGIIALSVPMYRYRRELRETFVRMCLVLLPCAALSLFVWNWIAALMGMDKIRALAFTARFMSTPLAIELANNVGADESITVILVVITGVVAAILKEQFFFRLMRVRKDDYLTVGLAMGATSGAIGANSLISTPRTMAIASLSFVIFGTMLLIATAIPPIVDVVQQLAS